MNNDEKNSVAIQKPLEKMEVKNNVEINQNEGLFSDNPEMVVQKATQVANILTKLISSKQLFTNIKGNKYVHVTGWNIMLSMLGIGHRITLNEIKENGREITSKCYCELFSIKTGNIIGGDWGVCSNKEPSKRNDPVNSIQSMAQTRALGKAARMSCGWVVKLAGYEVTPEEEMIVHTETAPEVAANLTGLESLQNSTRRE